MGTILAILIFLALAVWFVKDPESFLVTLGMIFAIILALLFWIIRVAAYLMIIVVGGAVLLWLIA